jgi:hypothetical protein
MSLNSFHLKGSGWYVTDYAGKKAGNQPRKSGTEEKSSVEKVDKSEKSDSGTKSSSDAGPAAT